jgi:hypothetical protein
VFKLPGDVQLEPSYSSVDPVKGGEVGVLPPKPKAAV